MKDGGGPVQGMDAWRAGIDPGAAPVRLRRIESLARRTAALPPGPARRLLEGKLAALMADYETGALGGSDAAAAPAVAQVDATAMPARSAANAGSPAPTATAARGAAPVARGPLSELAARLASRAPTHALHARAPSGETELLRHMHKIWSRLSADRRLTQSLAKVPDKAGPLNSHHLVHRALAAMREASPGYFHHFVAQVDALLALDQLMQAAASPAPAPAAAGTTAPKQRKGGRAKAS